MPIHPLIFGYANVDDTVFEVPGGGFRGVATRSFEAKTGLVDLVVGQQDATSSDGSAGERQLP